jgi:hypothetical protein
MSKTTDECRICGFGREDHESPLETRTCDQFEDLEWMYCQICMKESIIDIFPGDEIDPNGSFAGQDEITSFYLRCGHDYPKGTSKTKEGQMKQRAMGKAMISIFSRDPERWEPNDDHHVNQTNFKNIKNFGRMPTGKAKTLESPKEDCKEYNELDYLSGQLLEAEYQDAKRLLERVIEDLCVNNEQVDTPFAIEVVLKRLKDELS